MCVWLTALLSACASESLTPTPTTAPTEPPTRAALTTTPEPTPAPTATQWNYPWSDESAVMSGICFESANDAAGRTFIIRSPEDLQHFFNLADNAELCRQPVTRHEFDFREGRVLAGVWSRARGCKAHHEVQNVRRDDTARTLFIFLRLVVEGNCEYELVRPFWIGIGGVTDYEIQFVVE